MQSLVLYIYRGTLNKIIDDFHLVLDKVKFFKKALVSMSWMDLINAAYYEE